MKMKMKMIIVTMKTKMKALNFMKVIMNVNCHKT